MTRVARAVVDVGLADVARKAGGTGAGKGRHGFLNRFARSMFDAGYNQSDVISWTKDLDSRLSQWWDEGSKFAGRNDCDRQIQRLVQDAERRAK